MKKGGTHVYFNTLNKDTNTNMYKYRTGIFISKKNKSSFTYRSGYEYAYF